MKLAPPRPHRLTVAQRRARRDRNRARRARREAFRRRYRHGRQLP